MELEIKHGLIQTAHGMPPKARHAADPAKADMIYALKLFAASEIPGSGGPQTWMSCTTSLGGTASNSKSRESASPFRAAIG